MTASSTLTGSCLSVQRIHNQKKAANSGKR
jgi:hypothetical protein